VHVLGNLTAVRYRDEILQPHLMHVIDRQRELFQQDKSNPLPEHKKKRTVHSDAYIYVFCYHVSAAENETRR
jgi:hypothetical protein